MKLISKLNFRYIFISFIVFYPILSIYGDEKINILVEKDNKKVSLTSKKFSIIDERVGDKLYSTKYRKKITFYRTIKNGEEGIKFLNKFYPTTGLIINSNSGFIIGKKELKFTIAITIYKEKIYIINILPLESYIAGIINAEISSKWPLEAIKAQAVVSRTYAFKKKINNFYKPYDLNSSVLDQVYKGITNIDKVSIDAVKDTYGEVVTYNHELIYSFFHANSGGYTEGASYFGGSELPYLISKKDPYSFNKPRSKWSYKISIKNFEKILKNRLITTGKVKNILIVKKGKTGRVEKLKIVTNGSSVVISGEFLRKIVGYNKIFSSKFDVKSDKNNIIITGKGSGHGVGMSQWGAYDMAKKGKNYKDIINFYYSGVRIIPIY